MSKPVMRAPSAASASATARPWPCAAPVMNATLPTKSVPMPASLQRLALTVIVEISIEVHLQHVVDHVRGHHQTGKGCQGHNLLGIEKFLQLFIEVLRHSASRLDDGAPKCNQHISFVIQPQFVRIIAPLDQDSAH